MEEPDKGKTSVETGTLPARAGPEELTERDLHDPRPDRTVW